MTFKLDLLARLSCSFCCFIGLQLNFNAFVCFAPPALGPNTEGKLKPNGREALFTQDDSAEIAVVDTAVLPEIDLNGQTDGSEGNAPIDADKVKSYFEYDGGNEIGGDNREEMDSQISQDDVASADGFDIDPQNHDNDANSDDGYRIRKLQQTKTKGKEANESKNSTKETEKKTKE